MDLLQPEPSDAPRLWPETVWPEPEPPFRRRRFWRVLLVVVGFLVVSFIYLAVTGVQKLKRDEENTSVSKCLTFFSMTALEQQPGSSFYGRRDSYEVEDQMTGVELEECVPRAAAWRPHAKAILQRSDLRTITPLQLALALIEAGIVPHH